MNLTLFVLLALLCAGPAAWAEVDYTTQAFRLTIDGSGTVTGLYDRINHTEYRAPGQPASFVTVMKDGGFEPPAGLRATGRGGNLPDAGRSRTDHGNPLITRSSTVKKG